MRNHSAISFFSSRLPRLHLAVVRDHLRAALPEPGNFQHRSTAAFSPCARNRPHQFIRRVRLTSRVGQRLEMQKSANSLSKRSSAFFRSVSSLPAHGFQDVGNIVIPRFSGFAMIGEQFSPQLVNLRGSPFLNADRAGGFQGSVFFSFSARPSSFAFVSQARDALMADVSFRGSAGRRSGACDIWPHFCYVPPACGKKMATLRVGHEVEIVSWLGIERRAE